MRSDAAVDVRDACDSPVLPTVTQPTGLEKENAEADPSGFWGRPLPLDRIATASNGSAGVVAPACMEEEIDRNSAPFTKANPNSGTLLEQNHLRVITYFRDAHT